MLGVFTNKISTDFSGGGDTIRAEFADTQQLHKGDSARIGGVTVGEVKEIELDDDARSTTVSIELEDEAGPIYRDATAQVRWKTVLGGAFYLDIERGTKKAGELGGATIAQASTSGQVEVEDVTSVIRDGARSGLQTLPGELAKGLADPRAPARALGDLADVSPNVAAGVGALRGRQPDRDLRRLIAATATTVAALDTPTDDMRGVVSGAAATLQTTGARQAELRATIAQAPATIDRTEATFTRLDGTLDLADGLIEKLHGPAAQVGPTLRELRPTVVRADDLLHDAVPLLRSLRPAVTSLAHVSRKGLPLLEELQPALDKVDHKILPFLDEVDPETRRSTSEMIGPTFAGLGSGAAGQEDGNGHFIRFPATSGSSPLYLPCQIYFGNPDKDKIVACESLQKDLDRFLKYNPLGPIEGTNP
jgi:phospholipid/cholesterol/gamma-HCH transport system substrate-binding protein